MPRSVLLLGAAATLVVALGAALVLTADPRPDSRAAGSDFDWVALRSPYGVVLVPPAEQGWTVPDPRGYLFYADDRGEPLVGVRGPAVLDDGWCAAAAGASNRGFVGLLPPSGAPADVLVRRWAGAVGGRVGPVRRLPGRLADSSPAQRRAVVVRLGDEDPCTPGRVAVHLVTTGSPGRPGPGAVLVHDTGAGAPSPDVVDRVLGSLRPRARRRAQSLRSRT